MTRRMTRAMSLCFVLLASTLPIFGLAHGQGTAKGPAAELREAFEAEYRLFLPAPLYSPEGYLTRFPYSAEVLAFRERIEAIGPPVLPLLMEKLRELNQTAGQSERAQFLMYQVHRVARRWFAPEEWPGGKIGGTRESDRMDIVLRWWQAGQKGTTERFESLYSEWKRLKVDHSVLCRHTQLYEDSSKTISIVKDYLTVTELGRTPEAISGLGLGALPPMMEKLRAGDYDVLPFIAEITREEATSVDGREGPLEERARRCLEWWERNKERWTIPFPDVVQTTAAGPAVPAQPVTAEKATAPAGPQPKPDQPPAPARQPAAGELRSPEAGKPATGG